MRAICLLFALAATSIAGSQQPHLADKPFILQAETVIDDADLIDELASQQTYDAEMAAAQHDLAVLGRMVEGDAETKIVQGLKVMLFTTETCRALPLANNPDFADCLNRASNERMDVMRALGRRKVAGAWGDF